MTADFIFVSDDKYVKDLGVCIYSVIHNMSPNADKVRLFVMDCGITRENKAKLEAQAKRFDNVQIFFHEINSQLDNIAPKVENKWNRAIYGRLFLDEILGKYYGIKRIIYLDSDTIMTEPVTELFELDMQGKCIAAVRDSNEISRKRALQLGETDVYINSGVLVIDTEKWVSLDASRKIIDHINSFPEELLFPDQDAINIVLKGEITSIPLEYNMMWMICERDIPKMLVNLELSYTHEEISHALNNAKIIHFAAHDMWSMYGNTPIPIRAFVKYKNMSDWSKCRRSFNSPSEFILWLLITIKRKLLALQ